MNSQEQEALFENVRKHFPKWSKRKCSGYVHGIVDEAIRRRPCARQVKAFGPKRTYAQGYVLGFIDARGKDAFKDPRLTSMPRRTRHLFDYKWWE